MTLSSVILQIELLRNPLSFIGTFILLAGFLSLTAHIAARYVLGDVSINRAALIGPVGALILLFAVPRLSVAQGIILFAVIDFVMIHSVYRLWYGISAIVAIVHYTVSIILGFTIIALVRLIATAPL